MIESSSSKSLVSNLLLFIFLIAIIKIIFVYSVGRSHGGKLQLKIPSMSEWLMIIVFSFIVSLISGGIMYSSYSNSLQNNYNW